MRDERPLHQLPLLHQPWMVALAAIAVMGVLDASIARADWPMYRHDPARSGATSNRLDTGLYLQWAYHPRHAPTPAWPEPGKEMNRMSAGEPRSTARPGGLPRPTAV